VVSASPGPDDELRPHLERVLDRARARTLRLVEQLDDADLHEQHVGFMSPVVWDVGHIGNFEERWLVRQLTGRPSSDPDLDQLYNAFENPRWVRGELPILSREPALAYLAAVRDEVLGVLAGVDLADPERELTADGYVYRMLVSHESQHQETILQVLGMRADLGRPLLVEGAGTPSPPARVDDEARVRIPAGPLVLGTDDRRWTYDNERPAHRVEVGAFALVVDPVTNRRYARFIADGGYDRGEPWSDRGRQWLADEGHRAPQGWVPDADGGWAVRRFGRVVTLDPREPVQHVSWFEADAFCRWAGGRLPTEVEWEKAASWDPATGTKRRYPWGDGPVTPRHANVGLRSLGPAPVGSHPAGTSAYGVQGLAGDVYEWTSSPFEGYPGFVAFPYPEYSEVFFGGDWKVLRGSSWAIGAPLARCTYRNWDHPYRRQLLAGIRVAYDVDDR
jgi:iron(II)-dependent oxidoreductase